MSSDERPGNHPPTPRRRHTATPVLIAAGLLLSACATTVVSSAPADVDPTPAPASDGVDPTAGSAEMPTASAPPPASPTPTSTTIPATTTSSTAATTTTTSTTTVPTTIPVDPALLVGTANPDCVLPIGPDGSLERLATAIAADVGALWAENGLADQFAPGDLVDICAGNAVDDITGDPLPGLDDPTIEAAFAANVERQQTKLNELFADLGTGTIAADGVSGPITGQRLCAARLALGLDVSLDDMAPGSDEQGVLLAAAELPTPNSSAKTADRWVLIDRTCQMMFIGSGADTVYVFPTSTGSEGFETRTQDRAETFRFNPATDNGGWHDSTEFPVGVDNPLNGNLYKPLYFDLGQAIHGANNVPTTPQSKGCARLTVANQTTLLTWLDLLDNTDETWLKSEINLDVNVQGEYIGR